MKNFSGKRLRVTREEKLKRKNNESSEVLQIWSTRGFGMIKQFGKVRSISAENTQTKLNKNWCQETETGILCKQLKVI